MCSFSYRNPINIKRQCGSFILLDSRDICRRISEKYPERGNKTLFGTGVLEKASIEQWLQAEALTFDPPSSTLVFHLAIATALGLHPDQSLIEINEKKLANVLDIYERRLGENEYLAGDEFTLADLSHLPNANYLVTMTERGRKLFTARNNVERWWKAISARPSWRQVVQIQNEKPGQLKKLEI